VPPAGQLIGKPFDEETLFALRQKIEDAAGHFTAEKCGDLMVRCRAGKRREAPCPPLQTWEMRARFALPALRS